MMNASKIGSTNTYAKCLRQLTEFGYIKYEPSKSAQRGSKVQMFIFDTTANPTSAQQSIQHERPSTNTLNKKKQSKPLKQSKDKTSFSPPSQDEVKEYFLQSKSTAIQAEEFYDHFQSNGWLVSGKAKMKDWKAASRNWIKRSNRFNSKPPPTPDHLNVNQNKSYDIPL
jgi:hypothetical protein